MTAPPIHTQKELARQLGRSDRFVRAMKYQGFKLPATLDQAVTFLRRKPHPCSRKN